MLEREGGLVVEHRGDMVMDGSLLTWYTAQPDPSHWVAVGSMAGSHARTYPASRVYVGVGRTEVAATQDLLRSAVAEGVVLDLLAAPDDAWIAEWSL